MNRQISYIVAEQTNKCMHWITKNYILNFGSSCREITWKSKTEKEGFYYKNKYSENNYKLTDDRFQW